MIVLITRDLDRGRVARLLDGWRIDDQTDGRPEPESGPDILLIRAVLRLPTSDER